jgi:hypothetical protein
MLERSMRIAILGWGSLIWDPRELPRTGVWQPGGPVLPIEFSRVSMDRRLTLVIDPANGVPVVTRYVVSPREELNDAVNDLREREGTEAQYIGFVNVGNAAARRGVHPPFVQVIHEWAAAHGFDAVVWTDLPSNFHEVTHQPFSVQQATDYLSNLTAAAADRARRYVQNAPPEVNTPVRRALQDAGWLTP